MPSLVVARSPFLNITLQVFKGIKARSWFQIATTIARILYNLVDNHLYDSS
jgi:hypothetical protein